MKLLPIVMIACAVGQSAFAEGHECRRVADPVPRLSCVEKPTTAEIPPSSRSDATAGDSQREPPSRREADSPAPRTTRICRNC